MKTKGKLTLCDWNEPNDVPQYEVSNYDEFREIISHWLETKEHKKTVFVCFQTWDGVNYENEVQNILITHFYEYIEIYECDNIEHINIKYLNYSIFEFENYEEAFKYCIDLKEGL